MISFKSYLAQYCAKSGFFLQFFGFFWFKLNNFKTKNVIGLKLKGMLQLINLHVFSKFHIISMKTATCRVTHVFTLFFIILAHSATGTTPKYIVNNAKPTLIICANFSSVLKKLRSVKRFMQYFQKIVQKIHFWKIVLKTVKMTYLDFQTYPQKI